MESNGILRILGLKFEAYVFELTKNMNAANFRAH